MWILFKLINKLTKEEKKTVQEELESAVETIFGIHWPEAGRRGFWCYIEH